MSTDWIPCELTTAGQRSLVRWIHPGAKPLFTEPFFRQTIDALVQANAVQKLTPLEALAEVAPAKAPAGFIFHVSRCGSTLVSRSLAGIPRHRVVSEPAPVNQWLLAHGRDSQAKWPQLKGLIHALCGTAAGVDCFIKFTSWNLLHLQQLLALFPATPWVFVYRDPVDVLQSLVARPPRWAALSQLAPALGGHQADGLQALAQVLQRLFAAPLPHWSGRALAINYAQLPAAMADIAGHFGLRLDAAEQASMVQVAQYDAKQAGEVPFRPRERAPVSDAMASAMAPLNLLWDQWEAMRAPSEALHAH